MTMRVHATRATRGSHSHSHTELTQVHLKPRLSKRMIAGILAAATCSAPTMGRYFATGPASPVARRRAPPPPPPPPPPAHVAAQCPVCHCDAERLRQKLALLEELGVCAPGLLIELTKEPLKLGQVRARAVGAVVESKGDCVVELEKVVRLHVNGFLVGGAGVVKVVQPAERHGQVDGGGEVVEGRRVLASVEVDQPQIVRDNPLKRVEEEGALEAGDGGNVALLAEEAHADVVPQLRRVWRLHRRDAVLD
eukprot:scaffold392_cov101-Isochrysis_galbana.AAC.2